MNAKRIFTEHPDNYFWNIHTLPLALIEIVLDVLFNAVFGTVMFLELPQYQDREWRFSWRVQRHVDNAIFGSTTTWRHSVAIWWAKQLNVVDSAHINLAGIRPPWEE